MSLTLIRTLLLLGVATNAQEKWPEAVREIRIPSTADGEIQPALFYAPDREEKKPLLVALHTWSGDYLQDSSIPYAQWCIEKEWVFIHPNFRGPNRAPQATGSDLAVQDVLDAVEYTKKNASVDEDRIYLIGVSGGGYMSLLMAGRAPEVWAGVSAWVPLTDLKQWHIDSVEAGREYAQDIVASVGGDPTKDPAAAEECRKRSPLTYLDAAKSVPIDINAGIHDGHTGSIPIRHSLEAFNLLADPKDRISEAEIDYMVEKEQIPPDLQVEVEEDPLYGEKKVLFRRESNNVRITLFEGGHEIIFEAGLTWLDNR
jgi:poly(3-hydroxybutyrate) depolymerase